MSRQVPLDIACGVDLDRLADSLFNVRRYPGESDMAFRKRVIAQSTGAGVVKLGPITIYDRAELEVVYKMFQRSIPTAPSGPRAVRDTLLAIIDAQKTRGGGPTWPAGSEEQVLFEVAKACTDDGFVVEGVVLTNGQRTRAYVSSEKLDVWYAAMTLILDDGEG